MRRRRTVVLALLQAQVDEGVDDAPAVVHVQVHLQWLYNKEGGGQGEVGGTQAASPQRPAAHVPFRRGSAAPAFDAAPWEPGQPAPWHTGGPRRRPSPQGRRRRGAAPPAAPRPRSPRPHLRRKVLRLDRLRAQDHVVLVVLGQRARHVAQLDHVHAAAGGGQGRGGRGTPMERSAGRGVVESRRRARPGVIPPPPLRGGGTMAQGPQGPRRSGGRTAWPPGKARAAGCCGRNS